MLKRGFDILFSLSAILLLLPVFIVVAFLIKIDSKGSVFYIQKRVGRFRKGFLLYKFRTMFTNSHKIGLLTVGDKDNRITKIGYFLRKYKIDELPQFINVLKGDMSIVGPRPEVEKYVSFYNSEQLNILNIKPGITDEASIVYRNESEILSKHLEPEKFYIHNLLPNKIAIGLKYIENQSFLNDLKIILKTIFIIIKK